MSNPGSIQLPMVNRDSINFPDRLRDDLVDQRTTMSYLRDNSESRPSTSCDNNFRINNFYNREDDKCQYSNGTEKKRKTSRNMGWGLRRFSTLVCKKIEAKGRTTYNEVADEIVAEVQSMEKNIGLTEDLGSNLDQICPNPSEEDKNIRRRVYDAFNVLMSINVIAKDKKEICWIGFPSSQTEELAELKKLYLDTVNRIQEKANFLKGLEEQFVNRRRLIVRNQRANESGTGSTPSDGIALPFLLVQTKAEAHVEIEISEDMRLVRFDFNGTPFQLHDDATILKALNLPESMEVNHLAQALSDGSPLIRDQHSSPVQPVPFSWSSEKPNQ